MSEQTVQSAQRIFRLLELLARQGTMGVTELSTASGLNKTTVFRQLNTLIELGYVCRDAAGRYRLTLKLLTVAGWQLARSDLRAEVHPYLCELAEAGGETVHLVQREGSQIVYIDKVEPTVNSVRMVSRVGLRQPMTCTAVGKALLAALPASERTAIWAADPPQPLTAHTIVRWPDFEAEMARVRACGYATDDEENELGVRCVAVALPDFAGGARCAVSISAPITRLPDRRVPELAALLLGMKRKIENQ